MKTVIVNIEGGIGHHFASTAALRELKQDGYYVIVLASFLEVFRHNPHIDELMSIGGTDWTKQLYIRFRKEHMKIVHPSIYREGYNFDESPRHIKQVIAEQCGYEIDRDSPLDYYPTDEELDKARFFKEKKTENGKRKLGIIQYSGAGIGGNPVADIKVLPKEMIEDVIRKTKKDIAWIQVRMGHERPLVGAEYDLVDYDHRKMFALLHEADIGLGVDSFAQHLMAGVKNIPFILCCGRSRKENYAHPSARIVENPNSCEFFGCEFPFFGLTRICNKLDCFNSITAKQIIKELY